MATIIKSEQASQGAASGAVAFNFNDMAQKADRYLQQVREQAAAVVASAKKDAAQIRQQAQEEGRQQGLRDAEQQIKAMVEKRVAQEMKTLRAALGKAVESLQADRQQWLALWEGQAVRLAAAIAERILRREQETSPQVALPLVRESLELAAGCAEVAVRLHPRDLDALGEDVEKIASQLAQIGKPKLVADDSVPLGGCVVTTEFGEIDQRLETQLERIVKELT